jgi:hypothetical protein
VLFACSEQIHLAALALKLACLIGFVFMAGCGTTDTRNTSEKPWNQPTKSEISQGWWFRDFYQDEPGNHYP